jgi:hypothetical protein
MNHFEDRSHFTDHIAVSRAEVAAIVAPEEVGLHAQLSRPAAEQPSGACFSLPVCRLTHRMSQLEYCVAVASGPQPAISNVQNIGNPGNSDIKVHFCAIQLLGLHIL